MGFKVTRDFVNEKEYSQVGTESAPPSHWIYSYIGKTDEDYPYKGGKIKARLLDDDNGIMFHGLLDDSDFSAEQFLDWGASSGATSLDLSMKDWKEENGEDIHPYPSKDGKWVSYMG